MTLDIDNEAACRLAREPAKSTGESACEAVSAALRGRLERETRKRSVEHRVRKMRAVAKPCAAPTGLGGPGSRDIDALLCDEPELPVRGDDSALVDAVMRRDPDMESGQ